MTINEMRRELLKMNPHWKRATVDKMHDMQVIAVYHKAKKKFDALNNDQKAVQVQKHRTEQLRLF